MSRLDPLEREALERHSRLLEMVVETQERFHADPHNKEIVEEYAEVVRMANEYMQETKGTRFELLTLMLKEAGLPPEEESS